MNKLRICLMVSLAACSAQDENKATTPDQGAPNQGAPEPQVIAPAVAISFASVQMLDDCPDPPEEAPAAVTVPASLKPVPAVSTVAPPARRAPASSPPSSPAMPGAAASHYTRPCMQSTVQLSFENKGSIEVRVSLSEVRFLSASGKSFGMIVTRSPMRWQDNGYHRWNERLTTSAELKASYKLSVPNWGEVEKALGSSSYGPMYVLEADIAVGNTVTTVRSAPFSRQRPMVPPT